jgi:TonB-dependent receptor
MPNPVFNKTPLAVGVALALGASIPSHVYAQGADDGVVEEIVVTGIRGSLTQSANIKRFSDGVVDAISAEDIGKFPDTNLAESLQRISGVSIDRSRGEGSKVTVRGFGPQFNLVLLNGRQMPTQTGVTNSRSFDFADLASEGISGVQVYKTSRAELPTGGIGATINIQTTKPLEVNGTIATFGVKAVNDTSTDTGSNFTPEVSGLFSTKFADDTIGIALSGSYQERDNGLEAASVNGWNTTSADVQCCDWGAQNVVWGAVPDNPNQINRPTVGSGSALSIPQQLQYRRTEYNRTRVNGQLTLQWEPISSLTGTLDYTVSQLELAETFSDFSSWFAWGNAEQLTEWTGDSSNGPVNYNENSPGGSDTPMGSGQVSTKNLNQSVGLNLEWRATDRLSLEFDFHNSSAEVEPDSPLGSSMSLAITSGLRASTSSDWTSDLPILNVGLLNGTPITANDMLIGGSVFTNRWNEMDLQQTKLSGEFELNDTASINFGIQKTDVDNRNASTTVQRDTWGGVGAPGDIADLLSPASMAGWFDEISGAGDTRRVTDLFTWDTNALIARARELEAAGTVVSFPSTVAGTCGDGFCPSFDSRTGNFVDDKLTQEEQLAVYLQLNLDLLWGDSPVNLDFGLRYEETDVFSQAQVPSIARIDWITSNELPAVTAQDANGQAVLTFTELEGSYDNWLPNVDFNIEFIDDVLFRASYSETISRPGYNDIRGGLTVAGVCRVDGCDGGAGSPSLKPLESQNIDLSLEWYYAEGSYASVGYFHKDVENFIGTSVENNVVLFPELTNPAQGGLAAQASAALGGTQNADDIRAYIFANFANDPSVDVVNQTITGTPANDAALFTVTRPANQESAVVDGFELAIQHTFGESGFGVLANATFVDANIAVDLNSLDTQFALAGLSDSANFIGFYDKSGLQVRIAYNWRDEFLSGFGHDIGNSEPRFVEEFGQWDFNASYDFRDKYTVFVEGINITNETFREHARHQNSLLQAQQTGPRYGIGVRAKF